MGKHIAARYYVRGERMPLSVSKPDGKASLGAWALRVAQVVRNGPDSARVIHFAVRYNRTWWGYQFGSPPHQIKCFSSEAAAEMWLMHRSKRDG